VIWLATNVLAAMRDEALSRSPLETGGVLLGWRSSADKVIVDIIGPGPDALHGRFRFLPDHSWQIQRIRERFSATGGDIDYLGDWHTHPDGGVAMSSEDRDTLKRISRKVPEALTLILAGEGQAESIVACWSGWHEGVFLGRQFLVEREPVKLFILPEAWQRFSECRMF